MDKKIDYSKIYSPTKLNMFNQCPQSYRLYYLDQIYSQMKSDLKKMKENIFSFNTLGKAIHNAITLFYYLPFKNRNRQHLRECLKQTWKSEVMWNKNMPLGEWGGFKTLDEERGAYGQALSMLNNFLKIAEFNPDIEFLPTNDFRKSIKDFENLIINLNEEIDISGKFDLVIREGDFLNVIDFKTGKNEDNNNFQLRFYKLLAEKKFQKPVKKASFYFLKSGHKVEFDLEKENSEDIKDEVLTKVKNIKNTQNFETKPGGLCRFCLFRNLCSAKEEVKEIIEKNKKEELPDDLPF